MRRVFGDRFEALVAYGVNASVVFVRVLEGDDLQAIRPLVDAWHRDGLATPLVVTVDEFTRSLDAFPLEYQSMLDAHTVIAGEPPFASLRVAPDDLRRACEAQARSHLIHLRQGWMDAGSHDAHLADLLVRSAEPFQTVLLNVARLSGAAHASADDLERFAAQTIGMPAGIARDVLELIARPERGRHLLARVGDYLHGAERLWDFVDTWRAR